MSCFILCKRNIKLIKLRAMCVHTYFLPPVQPLVLSGGFAQSLGEVLPRGTHWTLIVCGRKGLGLCRTKEVGHMGKGVGPGN